jgi:diguanylate cyclase (GGDEF)-like protein
MPALQAVDYASVFDATPTPHLVVDPSLCIVAINQAYVDVVGRARDELVGMSLLDLYPVGPTGRRGQAHRDLHDSLGRVLRTGQPDAMAVQRYDVLEPGSAEPVERYWNVVNVPVFTDGTVAWVIQRVQDVTGTVQAGRVQDGDAAGVHESAADLVARAEDLQRLNHELRRAHDQLADRALHDPMTGLLVRSVFLESLAHALGRLLRQGRPLAVLFVDLDGLKRVNDIHGHAAGDSLIRACADRLRASLRPSDSVARVGGDEFLVLLEDLHDPSEAERIATRVLDRIAEPTTVASGIVVRPTASIGVAVTRAGDIAPSVLVAQADTAMYRAKQAGKGGYSCFNPSDASAVLGREGLDRELRAAVAHGQLQLYYQPIVDLSDGAISGAEVLLRWDHPTVGLLPAGRFIDVAEDSGLILDIGAWVLREACAQLAAWDEALGAAAPSRLFLNFSVAELARPGLAEHLQEVIVATGVSPDRLVVEIREGGIRDEPRAVRGAALTLRHLGCRLAIDDFGTGQSSLSRLVSLPAEFLKLDGSLVSEVHSDDEASALVSAVLMLAHHLGRAVVAEGVEHPDTARTLRELGCEYGQGYLFAHPESAQALGARLRGGGEGSQGV